MYPSQYLKQNKFRVDGSRSYGEKIVSRGQS